VLRAERDQPTAELAEVKADLETAQTDCDKYHAELAEARAVIRRLLQSSDSSWYAAGLGHDWKEAVNAAERFAKNAAIASGKGGE